MLSNLYTNYNREKDNIKSRISEFKSYYDMPVSWFYIDNKMILQNVESNDNVRLFEELVFCILTANTSASMSLIAVDSIRDVLVNGSFDQLQKGLKKAGYRYPNKRADYIIYNRENFFNNFNLRTVLNSYDDTIELRNFLVNNIKGFGYKEASHFLRNIGFSGLAILDKHILRSLHELGVLKNIPTPLNKNKYLDVEKKYLKFCNKINIDSDEMDLLLWSMKTGRIMK